MRKRFLALIVAALMTGTMLTGCGSGDTDTTDTTGNSSIISAEDELSVEEEETEESVFVWTVDDIALFDGIITGVEDYELSITSDELDGVIYDDSIILDVEIDLSGVDSTVAGEYDAVYLISADRDALLEYIAENEIDLDEDLLAELNAYAGDTVIIEVPVVVTVVVATEDNSDDADTVEEGTADDSDKTTTATASAGSSSDSKSSGTSNSSGNKNSTSSSTSSKNSTSSSSGSSTKSSSSGSTSSSVSSSNSSSSSSKSSGSSSSSSSSGSSSKSSTSSSGSSSSSSSNKSSGSSSSSSSSSSHKHSYTSKVTKAATCGSTGTKTYTCSCGDSYTETIAKTGEHTWKETGYYETVTVTDQAAYQEKYPIITCNICGATYGSYSEWTASDCSVIHGGYTVSYGYINHEAVTHTEQQWISTGYKCSVCGATK